MFLHIVSSRAGGLWLSVWLSVGSVLLWQAAPQRVVTGSVRPDGLEPSAASTADGAHVSRAVGSRTRAISEVRCGDRLDARNPELSASDRVWQEPRPESWRLVRLQLASADDEVDITLLRPVEWLDALNAQAGATIELDLRELGVVGPATVESVEPCPPLASGDGPLVTGTFRHRSARVLNLSLSSESEPLGVTDNHPIWSEDRQAFVEAGDLQPGERLRTLDGSTCTVTSISERGPPEDVYNLEVHGEHVYCVTTSGILVHNTKGEAVAKAMGRARAKLANLSRRLHADELGSIGPRSQIAIERAGQTANRAVHVAGQGSITRKVNLRADTEPKWGLTKKHLNKHFFGSSKFSLKKIDPSGTADKWKQHLADLYNAPVTGTTSNGMLDIVKTFPRADGSGTFKMGIRLFDRGDGSFDLVTVLTKQ